MLEYFRELGRSWCTLRDIGCRSKISYRSNRKYFKGAGVVSALFSGSKEALTSPRTYQQGLIVVYRGIVTIFLIKLNN